MAEVHNPYAVPNSATTRPVVLAFYQTDNGDFVLPENLMDYVDCQVLFQCLEIENPESVNFMYCGMDSASRLLTITYTYCNNHVYHGPKKIALDEFIDLCPNIKIVLPRSTTNRTEWTENVTRSGLLRTFLNV